MAEMFKTSITPPVSLACMNRAQGFVLFAVVLAWAACAARWSAAQSPSLADLHPPVLQNTCLITSDLKRLVDFYEQVLERKAKWSGTTYAEIATGASALSIFSADAQEKYIPGSAQAAANRSVILEFEVADADREYARLKDFVKTWVKPPATQPWGTRSIYFRDPDGNLVDFFVRAAAK
jgi:uncharacterized glyoxalase superfamily protein PhnB